MCPQGHHRYTLNFRLRGGGMTLTLHSGRAIFVVPLLAYNNTPVWPLDGVLPNGFMQLRCNFGMEGVFPAWAQRGPGSESQRGGRGFESSLVHNACDQILVPGRTAKFAGIFSAFLFQPLLSKSLILNSLETY